MNILQGPRIEGVGNPNSDQGPSTNDGDFVWILLGVTGAGKSCLGNFIFGEKVFEVSSHISISQTVSAFRESRTVEGQNLHIIDTPGLGDTGRIGTQESRVEDAANDAAHLIVELTKIMLTRNGISSFLIIVPLNHRDFAGLQQLLDFCDILGDYWNHSILVFTHGLKYGSTESQQYIELENVLGDARGPVVLRNAYNRVNKRAVIVEAKRWRKDRFGTGYRSRTVAKLVSLSGSITATHGCYQDNLQSIGNKAYERANLLLQRQFKDLKSKEAKAAIFQEVYEEVRQVIHDLIEVKLTGGSIDKPKEMHKIKQQKLVTLNDQVAMLQQQAEEAHREICRLEDINKDLQQNKRILSRSVKRLEAADKRKSQQIERGKEGRKQLMGQVKAERKKRQDAKRQLEDEKKEMKKVRKEFVLLEKQKTTAAEEIVRLREAKCNETTRFKKEKLDIMRLRKKDKMELQQATRKQLKRKEDKTKEVKDKKKALQKQMKVEQAAKEVVLQKLQTAEKALQSAKRDAEKESMQKQMKVDKVTREAELHILRWQEAEKALQSVQHEAEREKDEYKIQCQALQNKLKSTEEEVVREKRDFELQFNILQREKDAAEKKIKDMKERNWWKRLRNED